MTFDIDTFGETSATATISESAALFGATPEGYDIDNREWDATTPCARCATTSTSLPRAPSADGFQIADKREHLLSGIVNAFDAQVRRLDRA